MIVSRVGKCIDAVLGDHKPVKTRRDLLPDQLAELCEIDGTVMLRQCRTRAPGSPIVPAAVTAASNRRTAGGIH